MCVLAWVGVLGSVEATWWLSAIWGLPVALCLMTAAVVFLFRRALQSGHWGAMVGGAAGAVVLLTGRFVWNRSILLYAGLALMIVSLLHIGRTPVSRPSAPCGKTQVN